MCGRYTLHHQPAELAERFDLDIELEDSEFEAGLEFLRPRYNIAPSQLVPVIQNSDRLSAGSRELLLCKWGLVPFWAKDPAIGNKMINAKSETLAEKPSFRNALAKRRCLIPADGFYEWQKKGKAPSQPIFVRRRDGGLFAFAGLWEEWNSPDGSPLATCTIITTEPNQLISQFHHRMAVILKPEDESIWLDLKNRPADVLPLLRPYEADDLEAYPVSRAVNSPSFDDASCIAPLNQVQVEGNRSAD